MNSGETIWPYLFVIGSILLESCNNPATVEEGKHAAPKDSTVVSTAYTPTVFKDQQRLSKIKKALPEVEDAFEIFAQKNHLPGYAFGIVVEDTLIFSKSEGTTNITTQVAVTAESEFHIASMTKSFTAMAIVKLRDEGRLSLYDPVEKHLPELELTYLTKDSPAITIHNLLTMTSGLPEDNPWADRHLDDSNEEFLAFLDAGLTFSDTPYGYEYSNLGFAMLGTIISRVAEMPYQKYITNQILKPLGMQNTFWEYEEVPEGKLAQGYRWEEGKFKKEPMLHTGAFGAIGGLITSMEDFSKYVTYHLSAYPARNESEKGPLKRSSLREMHRITAPRLANSGECYTMLGYGYGLRIKKDCNELLAVGHSGGLPGFGSNYVFYPDYGIGIISFGNRTYAPLYAINEEAMKLIFDKSDIEPRKLPVSEILKSRTPQVVKLIKTWDEELGNEILADNFYLDKSRELRKKEADAMLVEAGNIVSVETIVPLNQLRGTFIMHGERADIRVFFSMSPEQVPKVQALRLSVVEHDKIIE